MQSTAFGRVHADWELIPLPDVLFYQEGPGLRRWQWTETGMKVINGKNVLMDGSIDISNTERFIAQDEFEKRYRHFAIEIGDIVVTSSGTIGKVARIRAEHLPMMMNTSVIRFRTLDSDVLTDEFVFAFLRSPLFAAQADVAATGAAQRNFGPVHLKQMQVPVPPLPVQRKIAAVLAAYDELIENNLRRIEILEEMAQAVYREWFVNFRFPGQEDVALVDSPLGPIPEGWAVSPIGERYEVSLGGTPPRARAELWEGDIPWINSGSVNLIRVIEGDEYITEEAVVTSNTKLWPRGATVIAITGATLGQVSRLAIDSCANQSVVGVWDPAGPDGDFIFYAVSDQIQQIIARAGGSAQQHINKGIVQDFPLFNPPSAIVRAFADHVGPLCQLLENLLQQNANLRATRDLLLPKLVSGEIDLSEIEIDTEWLTS